MAKFSIRIVLILLGSVLGIIALEGTLQLLDSLASHYSANGKAGRELFSKTSDALVYRMNPLVKVKGEIETNSLGFRSPEISVNKNPQQRRILVLGDSVSFGWHVSSDEIYPEILRKDLQKDLKDSSLQIEVINSGVPAYSPYNQRQVLSQIGRALAPDVIVIQFCINDISEPWLHWNIPLQGMLEPDEVPVEAIPDIKYHNHIVKNQWWRSSKILSTAKNIYRDLDSNGELWPIIDEEDHFLRLDIYKDRDAPALMWLRQEYKRIITAAREITDKIIILVVPLSYQLASDYPHLEPQRFMQSVGEEEGVLTLDLRKEFINRPPAELFLLRSRSPLPDIWHFTAEGHRLAGLAIAQSIKERGWLK